MENACYANENMHLQILKQFRVELPVLRNKRIYTQIFDCITKIIIDIIIQLINCCKEYMHDWH